VALFGEHSKYVSEIIFMVANLVWMGALAVLLIYNIYVSIVLFKFAGYSAGQKTVQLFIIWLLPAVGAVVVYSIIRPSVTSPRSYDRNFTPDNGSNPPGIGTP